MRIIYTPYIIILLFITSELLTAQSSLETKSSYVSVNLGGYKTSLGHKATNRYTASLTIGAGYGHALTPNTFIYSKFTYFTMPKFIAYIEQKSGSSSPNHIEDLQPVRASFTQYIFNLGPQYNFHLYKDFMFGIVGGAFYTLFNQASYNLDGTPIQRVKNSGIMGLFAGINIEKNFREDEVKIFGELQYNYALKEIADYRRVFSGLNYTIGLRFYLTSYN